MKKKAPKLGVYTRICKRCNNQFPTEHKNAKVCDSCAGQNNKKKL